MEVEELFVYSNMGDYFFFNLKSIIRLLLRNTGILYTFAIQSSSFSTSEYSNHGWNDERFGSLLGKTGEKLTLC